MSDNKETKTKLIGVISDTHNLLRPEAVEIIKNTDLIIHAGDVCRSNILDELNTYAPVAAVRGNNDKNAWAESLPVYRVIEVGEIFIYVIHDIKELNIYPAPPGINIVISGHSHKSSIKERDKILYLNPGSAGPKRFSLPVSVALLKITGKNVEAEIVSLTV